MNPLHLLPPEAAHTFAIWALKKGLGPRAGADDPSLRVSLLGKTFSNPIGLAAGAEKRAEALTGWARMGFGFVEAGTVTLHPRSGNPKPRVWRIKPNQVVNWMGLPGDGLDPFVARLKAFHGTSERSKLVVGASVASPDGNLDEFRALSAACAPWVDYLTLNGSCPNVAHGESDAPLQSLGAQIRAVVGEAGDRPVLLKLGPTRDQKSLRATVGAALEAGVSGFVATNTVPHDKRQLLGASIPFDWPQHQGKPVGGYSGPGLLDTACWMVSEIRAQVGKVMPVMGVGGVQSGADARRLLDSGANLIQLYTGFIYRGPKLLREIKQSLL